MPKKYSHANLPEADEYRSRAVKMFDGGELENTEKSVSNAPAIEKPDALKEESFDFETEKTKSKTRTAKEHALYLVSVNTYTERKLRDKLRAKQRFGERLYSDGEIDQAVEYLKGFGYINDARLAQNSISGLAARLWGRVKIRFYLIRNGIDEDIVDSLDYSDIDFSYYCQKLLAKHAGKPPEKQYRALANAGYTSDEIREAMRYCP